MTPMARFATPDDACELVRLRKVMYESMGRDASGTEWQIRCEAHVSAALSSGALFGAVVDAPSSEPPGTLAASGLAEVRYKIPSPTRRDPSAYLTSFSTDPRWRRQGMARAVLTFILSELRRRGVHQVELHATSAGEPLYRSVGFGPRAGGLEMRVELT